MYRGRAWLTPLAVASCIYIREHVKKYSAQFSSKRERFGELAKMVFVVGGGGGERERDGGCGVFSFLPFSLHYDTQLKHS